MLLCLTPYLGALSLSFLYLLLLPFHKNSLLPTYAVPNTFSLTSGIPLAVFSMFFLSDSALFHLGTSSLDTTKACVHGLLLHSPLVFVYCSIHTLALTVPSLLTLLLLLALYTDTLLSIQSDTLYHTLYGLLFDTLAYYHLFFSIPHEIGVLKHLPPKGGGF